MKSDPIIDAAVRKVPDFPKKGILFYDITGLLLDSHAFEHCIRRMVDCYRDTEIDAIAPVEARGFLFAAPLANRLDLPMILVRKTGKLPGATIEKKYDLEYGTETIAVHRDDVQQGQSILVVDDILATGGTTAAACELLREAGARVEHICAVIGLSFLPFREKLKSYQVQYFAEYTHEHI